jgi:hypothetical protein
MNLFEMVIAALIFGILGVSLIYTLVLGRRQKAVQGEFDTQIAQPIQKNVYVKNPIFLSYGIFFALVLFIILFLAISFY